MQKRAGPMEVRGGDVCFFSAPSQKTYHKKISIEIEENHILKMIKIHTR